MKKETERQLLECRNNMKPYMQNEKSTLELREMCKSCELYCGEEHDFEECHNRPYFNFWLAFKYLEWANTYR